MASYGGKREGAGRKKAPHTLMAEKAREYIVTQVCKNLEPIVTKMIEQAKAGDKDARKELLDRAFGKPTESMDITTGGEQLATIDAVRRNVETLIKSVKQ